MAAKNLLSRIEVDPKVMVGKPCIRGTRIPVWILIEKLAAGSTFDDILEDYPALKREDIRAALAYAASSLKNEEVRGIKVRVAN